MDLTLQQIFERARAAQDWIPAVEADALFAATVQLAFEQGVPLRPSRFVLTPDGLLGLAGAEEGGEPSGYLAPELRSPEPPRRNEGRVLVYAAGALGYELLTGLPPPELPALPGPELGGAIGDLVRVALSADRRERFGDLQQLLDAVDAIQPRDPAVERTALANVRARADHWGALLAPQPAADLGPVTAELQRLAARLDAQEAALGRLGETGPLPSQVAALEQALSRVEREVSSHREQQLAALAELARLAKLDRSVAALEAARQKEAAGAADDLETRRALAALRPPASPWLVAAISGLLAGAAGAAAALFLAPQPPAPSARAPLPQPAPASASAPSPAPAPASASASAPAPAPAPAPASAPAPAQPGATGPVAPTGAHRDGAALSPGRMARALARSLVDKGDSLLEKNRPAEAIRQFQAALDAQTDLPEAWRGLGMAFTAQHLDDKARGAYEKYLALAPAAVDATDIRRAIDELRGRSKLGGDEK